jgi:hypothetical protein
MIKKNVIFNEIKLIYKKSQSADSIAIESVRNDDSMKNVDLTDLLQSVKMRNIDLHQSNVESNQSIRALDQVIESMTSISEDEDDENVAFVFENQNQDSSASAENAENSIDLVDETILSNQKIELLNSLIMIDRRNKIRHDYKQLHTRKFAKAAKFVITAFHQIAIFSTYEKAISKTQVNQ